MTNRDYWRDLVGGWGTATATAYPTPSPSPFCGASPSPGPTVVASSASGPTTWAQSAPQGETQSTASLDPWNESKQKESCENWVNMIWQTRHVQFFVEELRLLGKEMRRDMVKCVGTQGAAASALSGTGGYLWRDVPEAGLRHGDITVSQKDCTTANSMSTAVRHELVHAFDDARAEVNPSNCFHHACSEIRASRLSGECAMGEEMLRGRPMSGDGSPMCAGKQCVKRRAILSVSQNPICTRIAQASVEKVWDSCIDDNAPYHKYPLDVMFSI